MNPSMPRMLRFDLASIFAAQKIEISGNIDVDRAERVLEVAE
jgi:hypothetical protein